MNNQKIKQIELLGKKLGAKQKPPVSDKNILFVAGFIHLNGFKTIISDGLLNKKDFLTPCIVLELKNKPKIRFKNEAKLFKKYLTQVKKKNTNQLSLDQYLQLLNLGHKDGETREYAQWRKQATEKKIRLKNLLEKYNKIRKSLNSKERFSILEFEDGTARLDFGNQTNLMEKFKKITFANKKKKLKQFINEFRELKKYLIKTNININK